MKHAGRPKVSANKAFAPGISVRLVPKDRETIEKAVAKSELSQSEWARKALLYVANSGINIT